MTPRPILIFDSLLLGASETFVLAQAMALRRFSPYFAGSRRIPGLSLPEERTRVVNTGGVSGFIKEGTFKATGFAPGLSAWLRGVDPVLVHGHFTVGGALALPIARRLRVPLVVTVHGGTDGTMTDEHTKRASFSERIYVRRRRAMQRQVSLFIAVSNFVRERLIASGYPPEKVVVHYIGIDNKVFSRKPDLGREPTVLFVGRLADMKGCEYLIRAMALVEARLPGMKLTVIGDGPLRAKLQKLAEETLPNFEFLGVQAPEVVREHMSRARVFSMPSVVCDSGAAEGFGMVLAEAQAMGLPVVSFAIGGIPEVVADGVTGFLPRERDVKGLAAGLERLLTDAELRERFAAAGTQRVLEKFDLSRQTALLEDIYERVLNTGTK